MLWTKEPVKVQVFRISTGCMKINQIPYAIFHDTSQFSFKFRSTFQCQDTQFPWNFLAQTLYAFDKKNPSKYSFLDIWVL